jgi:hypothetical protein
MSSSMSVAAATSLTWARPSSWCVPCFTSCLPHYWRACFMHGGVTLVLQPADTDIVRLRNLISGNQVHRAPEVIAALRPLCVDG